MLANESEAKAALSTLRVLAVVYRAAMPPLRRLGTLAEVPEVGDAP